MKLKPTQLKALMASVGVKESVMADRISMVRNYLNGIVNGKDPVKPEKLVGMVANGLRMPAEAAKEYVFTWELENLCDQYQKPTIAYVSPLHLNQAISQNQSNKKPLEERDFTEQVMYKLDITPSYARKIVEALRDVLHA